MPKFIVCCLALIVSLLSISAHCQNPNLPVYSELIPISSGLPYNPATDFRENFTAPNGKQVEVLIKGPVGSGTYTRAIRPGETPDQYFPAVVSEAVKAKAHHLVIPKAVYAFKGPDLCTDLKSNSCNLPTTCDANHYYNCNPHWQIGTYPQGQVTEPNSISDLDIDLSGSELDFSAPVIGIWILEAQRLRLRNFTIDWPALPIASLGTIVPDPDNPGHNALVIDSKYPVVDKYQGGPVQIQAVDPWDDNTTDPPGVFDAKSNNSFEEYFIFGNAPQPTYVGSTSAGSHTFSCKSCHFQNSPTDPSCSFFSGCANFDLFAPGSRVVVRHYTYNGLAVIVNWSNDIDFENVTLLTGPGTGIMVTNNGGYRGFRLANSKVVRKKGRPVSIASGAVDLALKSDVLLENNDIGYGGDDALAMHSATGTITAVSGDKIQVPGPCDPDPMDAPIAGDLLSFYDANFVFKTTARVVTSNGSACPTLELTLDHVIAGLSTTDNYLDLTQQPSARYIFRDNTLHECRCHGVLINAPYGLIDHNVMYGNAPGAIQLAGGNGLGPGATNLTISRNSIRNPGQSAQYYGAISLFAADANGNVLPTPVFEKIKVERNVIQDSPGPAVLVAAAKDFWWANNEILNSNQTQTNPFNFGSISTLDSVIVYQSSDGVVCGTRKTGDTTGPIGIDSSATSVTEESLCGWNSAW